MSSSGLSSCKTACILHLCPKASILSLIPLTDDCQLLSRVRCNWKKHILNLPIYVGHLIFQVNNYFFKLEKCCPRWVYHPLLQVTIFKTFSSCLVVAFFSPKKPPGAMTEFTLGNLELYGPSVRWILEYLYLLKVKSNWPLSIPFCF